MDYKYIVEIGSVLLKLTPQEIDDGITALEEKKKWIAKFHGGQDEDRDKEPL